MIWNFYDLRIFSRQDTFKNKGLLLEFLLWLFTDNQLVIRQLFIIINYYYERSDFLDSYGSHNMSNQVILNE